MCQGGSTSQDRQAKRGDGMDKESYGIMMEIYTLGDRRMTIILKERCMSCKRMALTHSLMSDMMKKGKR
jgi:hypothetical protein